MSARARILVTTVFVAFISVPLVFWGTGLSDITDENRPSAPLPDLRADRILDTEMYDDLADYLRDRTPLRGDAVELEASIDLEVFGDSPSDEVFLGADGWLFYDRPFKLPCASSMPVPELVERLGRFATTVADSGRHIRMTIAPDKPAIYADKLSPELVELGECASAKRAELRAALEEAPPSGYIDMWSELEAQDRAGFEVFYPNDSHWNGRAVTLLSATVIDSVSDGLWDPTAVVVTDEEHEGDLTRLMGLPSTVPTERYRVRRAGVVVERTETAVEGGPPLRHSTASGDVPIYDGRLVVLHDSFFNEAISVFQQYFAEAAILNWRSLSLEDVAAAIESADVVVVELVERGAYRHIETVVGSDDLLQLLGDRLDAIES